MQANNIAVGYIRDAHGLKGEVFIRLFAKRADWLKLFKAALLVNPEQPDSLSKYDVIHSSPHKDGLIVSLTGVTDRTQAEALKGRELLVPQEWLVSSPGETPYLQELLGFTIIDRNLGDIGRVESFSSNGAQDLFVTHRNGHEVLIPFIKPFVESMEFENRLIRMNLPEGLVE